MINPKTDYSNFRKGAERLEMAMAGVADRTPVLTQMHEFAMRELGCNAREFYTTPEIFIPGVLQVQEKYGIDVSVIDYDVYNIEAEALGQEIIYGDDHMPDVDRTRPLIRDHSDLEKIKTPDFDSDGRFAQVIEMKRIFRQLTGGVEPTLQFCAPFSLAANIRGLEQLLMDMYTNPDFAHALLDRLVENVLAPWILRLKEEFPGAAGVCGSDASGSLPIVSPEIVREWIIPNALKLRELCGPEVYIPNWVGESLLQNPEEMLDFKNRVCPGFIEGQDPDVETLGPSFYKAYAEKKEIPLVLGVGAAFMALSSPEEVAERIRHYIEVGGKNGRFALLLCNLGATTPPENVKKAIEVVHALAP